MPSERSSRPIHSSRVNWGRASPNGPRLRVESWIGLRRSMTNGRVVVLAEQELDDEVGHAVGRTEPAHQVLAHHQTGEGGVGLLVQRVERDDIESHQWLLASRSMVAIMPAASAAGTTRARRIQD